MERSGTQGAPASRVPFDADVWRRRIAGEYVEMPDLKLTTGQAARLWGIEAALVRALLEELRENRLLSRTPDGSYRLA